MGKMKEPAKKESTKKSFKKKGTKQTKKTITEKKSMQKKSKTPSKTAPKPKPKEKKTKMVKVEIKKKTSTKRALKKETKKEIKKGSAKIKELKPSVKAIRKESKEGKEKIEKKEAVRTSIKKKPTKVKEEKFPPTPFETLPAEYGENSITLMIVDPYKLFAFWEVREDTLKIFEGNLNMRVYDVTDIDLDCSDANSYCDIPVNDRIGSWYFDVTPGKEFIADIGIMYYEGIFITMARSNKVLPPRAAVAEVGILPERLYETGLPIGYGK